MAILYKRIKVNMSRKYHATLGFYEPSFFHINTIGNGKLKEIELWDTEQNIYSYMSMFIFFKIYPQSKVSTISLFGVNIFETSKSILPATMFRL